MPTTTTAYTARAAEYIDLLGSLSAVHPSDRQIIDSWAAGIDGRVLDAGCGPGHWTHHLTALGLDARGIDLVPAFIDHARSTYPAARFDLGTIDRTDEVDGALGGVLSWFSTIHHEPAAVPIPIAEFARVLRPGGRLALGFFHADEVEPFDHAVTRAFRWPAAALRDVLESAGFDVIATYLRAERGQRPVGTLIGERRSTTD